MEDGSVMQDEPALVTNIITVRLIGIAAICIGWVGAIVQEDQVHIIICYTSDEVGNKEVALANYSLSE